MHIFLDLHRFQKRVAILFFVLFFFCSLFAPGFVTANNTNISIEVKSLAPQIILSSVGDDGLKIDWNWDSVSVGYIPPAVSQMDVEISSNLISYTNLQQVLPSVFSVSYTGLSAGTYTARITVLDGADTQYVVGPVTLAGTSGGGGRRGGGDGGGGDGGGDGGGGTGDPPPDVDPPNVTLSGIAYPGPTSVVIFTYDGAFQTTVDPDSFGDFSYQTTSLPAGGATFAFSARDPLGNLSAPVSFFYSVSEGQVVTVDTIYLPPTLVAVSPVVPIGDDLQLSGYGYREGALALSVQGVSSSAVLTQANDQGFWSVDMPTAGLTAGTYDLVAVSTSFDGTITSPDSSLLTFELIDTLPSAPVCGDGTVETPEACDDGNVVDGDGCSGLCEVEGCGDGVVVAPEQCDDANIVDGDGCNASCQLEQQFPDTEIVPVSPSVFASSSVDLTYQVLEQPNGPIVSVQVYYSLDGASYVLYPEIFSTSDIQLNGLADGDYDVYSVARDSAGFLETAPFVEDASFTIDVIKDFDVLAYPEKRVPATGNWGLSSSLNIYELGNDTPRYSFDIITDDEGQVRVDLDETFAPGIYDVVLKGRSHLSKRLEDVSMTDFNDLLLDFTLANTFSLLAGDVQSAKDDYVNSLDVSAMLGMLYLNNIDGDLNLDSSVNALDLSVVMRNLLKSGDGSR